MIKAIILDIDGVIIGTKQGINVPYPHTKVTVRLKEIQDSGIPITLCTGKAQFSVIDVIKTANLNNTHITNNGATILDPIAHKTISQFPLEKGHLEVLADFCKTNNLQLELYTASNWYVEKGRNTKYTKEHGNILDQPAKEVDSLREIIATKSIIKAIVVVDNDEEERKYAQKFKELLNDSVKISWTCAPIMLPAKLGLFTKKGVSKESAIKIISKSLNISTENMLGVGDNEPDWQFMQHCGYVAAMGNASDSLKKLVKSKKNHFIGQGVDENGIIGILDYFSNLFKSNSQQ